MGFDLLFFVNSFALGVGLAMDAFSVSVVNGMREPEMRKSKLIKMAGVFAFFQFAMPMIGWLLVRTVVETFKGIAKFVPWIALALLLYIGGKMLWEGIEDKLHPEESTDDNQLTKLGVIGQGVATSIDALSVGFAISTYNRYMALVAGLIIGVITFVLCLIGGAAGKSVGSRLSGNASILGGSILIIIGIRMIL